MLSKSLETRISQIAERAAYYEANRSEFFDLDNAKDYGHGRFLVTVKQSFHDYVGVRRISNGHFSSVYDLEEENAVLKIADRNEDPAYWAFVDLCCEQDEPNPHFPTVMWRGQLNGHEAAVIEKLSPMGDDEREFIGGTIRAAFKHRLQYDRPLRYGDEDRRPMDKFLNPEIFGERLTSTLQLLKERFQDARSHTSMSWDMHGDNIMMRGNMPVITDPWSSY